MSTKTDLRSGVEALFGLSEADLQLELGIRLMSTAEELSRDEPLSTIHPTGQSPDRSVLQASVLEFARATAEKFIKRFNNQMYSLICDDSDPEHETIRTAALQGGQALGFAISGALVATFGWLPGIATVIAVIIAKRAATAGHQALCETWKESVT